MMYNTVVMLFSATLSFDSRTRGRHGRTRPVSKFLAKGGERFCELFGNPERIDGLAGFRNLLQAESFPLYIYHA